VGGWVGLRGEARPGGGGGGLGAQQPGRAAPRAPLSLRGRSHLQLGAGGRRRLLGGVVADRHAGGGGGAGREGCDGHDLVGGREAEGVVVELDHEAVDRGGRGVGEGEGVGDLAGRPAVQGGGRWCGGWVGGWRCWGAGGMLCGCGACVLRGRQAAGEALLAPQGAPHAAGGRGRTQAAVTARAHALDHPAGDGEALAALGGQQHGQRGRGGRRRRGGRGEHREWVVGGRCCCCGGGRCWRHGRGDAEAAQQVVQAWRVWG
jgi:hypothetical protein